MDAAELWAAVRTRDDRADGSFVYGVVTTGVFCRPSCPSRRPRPENVRFFAGPTEAEAAGFRPCLRCDPHGPGFLAHRAEIVERACRIILEAVDPPTLADLAAAVGLSPHHFHRLFKAETGITPKAYAVAHRAARMRAGLQTGASVTDAIYAAGFGSNGRFYETSTERLGMTPSELRAGAPAIEVRFAVAECSLGSILVAATSKGVCAVEFGDPDELVRDLQHRFHSARLVSGDRDFETLVQRVVAFIEDPSSSDALPLDIRGTVFQERVWRALRVVPAGSTTTYSELADRIGSPTSARAVAAACAANHLAVAIPCHRVVRKDGSVSGYRWGEERKRALLQRERVALTSPPPPHV